MLKSIFAATLILVMGVTATDLSRAQETTAPATPAAPGAPAVADYASPAVWLCRPERQDTCTVSHDATTGRCWRTGACI
jgi:hypothetical protein